MAHRSCIVVAMVGLVAWSGVAKAQAVSGDRAVVWSMFAEGGIVDKHDCSSAARAVRLVAPPLCYGNYDAQGFEFRARSRDVQLRLRADRATESTIVRTAIAPAADDPPSRFPIGWTDDAESRRSSRLSATLDKPLSRDVLGSLGLSLANTDRQRQALLASTVGWQPIDQAMAYVTTTAGSAGPFSGVAAAVGIEGGIARSIHNGLTATATLSTEGLASSSGMAHRLGAVVGTNVLGDRVRVQTVVDWRSRNAASGFFVVNDAIGISARKPIWSETSVAASLPEALLLRTPARSGTIRLSVRDGVAARSRAIVLGLHFGS